MSNKTSRTSCEATKRKKDSEGYGSFSPSSEGSSLKPILCGATLLPSRLYLLVCVYMKNGSMIGAPMATKTAANPKQFSSSSRKELNKISNKDQIPQQVNAELS
ncbi:hypothetical protein HZH68_009007 [Vespula germanica]|uniref:Uncharacterized protein n=2 Tax=Vespula TaxID=7451 RepID=A0A834N5S2_VESGE|nr:hypothetical protein HZH68_009007 [Vespula germanica]KAF7421966.1 hypothetical protein H0235_009802 [Vespula pensylvanica]